MPLTTRASTQDQSSLIPLDAEAFIQTAINLLASERYLVKGMGLMALTGRRPAEIKANPSNPSADAMLRLVGKLKAIEATGVLGVDLSWLSGNYQRALFHQVRKSSAARLQFCTFYDRTKDEITIGEVERIQL